MFLGHQARTKHRDPLPPHPSDSQPASSTPGPGEDLPHHDPRPPGLGQSHRPGLGLRLICSQPGPSGPLPVPQVWPASSQPPQKLDFPPKPAQGAWQTHSTIKRKTLPHQAPSHCPEAFKNPWSARLSPGPPPQGGCWGPKHGPLSGRAGGGGSCSWGIRKLPSWET